MKDDESEDAAARRRIQVLYAESDRGCALVGAAILEESLANLLRASFVPGTAEELLGQDRPLGTFSARIKAARAIGLIDKTDFTDLELVRKIRNDTAHFEKKRGDGLATGFSNKATKARCLELSVAVPFAAAYNLRVESLHPKAVFCLLVEKVDLVLDMRSKLLSTAAASQGRADTLGTMLKFVELGSGLPPAMVAEIFRDLGPLDPRLEPRRLADVRGTAPTE
jgi:hypothetical protein